MELQDQEHKTLVTVSLDETDKPEETLQIKLLGALEITLGGRSFTNVGSKKAVALFCYLCLSTKAVSRNILTALLWPEMDEAAAKNNLRSTLTILRRVLGSYLTITSSTVAFHRQQPYQIDVELLYTTLEKARSTQKLELFQQAITYYRGEFLSGFQLMVDGPFDEWLRLEREQLHREVLQSLETMLAQAVAHDYYQIGLDAGYKWLELEPWSESAHRQLMLLFAMHGQRERALRQYQLCRQILATELGVEPMEESARLYQQICDGQVGRIPAATAQFSAHVPAAEAGASQRTLAAPPALPTMPNNLLAPLGKFVGRRIQLAYLCDQLMKDNCRLLTILGPGGVGKSALAMAVGHRLLQIEQRTFANGIFFVPLADVEVEPRLEEPERPENQSDEYTIFVAIAKAIGYEFPDRRPVNVQLLDYLQHRRLLLILDNFEQLVAEAHIVINLLEQVPTLTILITSRIALNVRGEMTLTLTGLTFPSTTPELPIQNYQSGPNGNGLYKGTELYNDNEPSNEAIALFLDRAQNVKPGLVLNQETIHFVTQICRQLAGLPLAIEITAAWLKVYSFEEVVARLSNAAQPPEILTSLFQDQSARHQTLQQVFDDSWHLLPPEARLALAKISIFSGQFPRAAAQAVAKLSVIDLMSLYNHSMLQTDKKHNYSLHPLLRHFAATKWQEHIALYPEEEALLYNAHSAYYLQRIAQLAEPPYGEAEFAMIHSIRDAHAEVVRAWQWALQQPDSDQIRQAMAGLLRYLEVTNQSHPGKILFGLSAHALPEAIQCWLQVAQCHFLRRLAEYNEARQQLEHLIKHVLPAMVSPANAYGAPDSEQKMQFAIETECFATIVLGWIYYEQGDHSAALASFITAQNQAERIGHIAHLMAAHNGLGAVAFSQKQSEMASHHYRAALAYAKQQEDLHFMAIILGNLAALAQANREFVEAKRYLQMRLEVDQKTQNMRQMAISYQRLGQMALIEEHYSSAESHLRKSGNLFAQLGGSLETAHILLDISKCLLGQKRVQEAEEYSLRSLQVAMQRQLKPRILAALTHLAEIRVAENKTLEALKLLHVVNRYQDSFPLTWQRAQKLEETLLRELGQTTLLSLSEDDLDEITLQEIGEQQLQQFVSL